MKKLRRRNHKNLWIISLHFMLLFTSFIGLAHLQSTLNVNEGLGVITQGVMFGTGIVSSMFLPKIFIRNIGHRKTLIVSAFVYCVWVAANAHADWTTMVSTSALAGLFMGPLWSAQSSYVTLLARYHGDLTGEELATIAPRFMGIFNFAYSLSKASYLAMTDSHYFVRHNIRT